MSNPVLADKDCLALCVESVVEAVYGIPVIQCPVCGFYNVQNEEEFPERVYVAHFEICDDCKPIPSKPGGHGGGPEPSPWMENAVRALEDF